MMYNVEELNGTSGFLGMREVWNSVLDRCSDKNVFLTWEYLSTAWKHFGDGKGLRILVLEDRNEIIAIAPLKQSRYRLGNLFGYNVIQPLGYGCADYTGLMFTKMESECLTSLLNYLLDHDHWDFIYMLDIPGTSMVPKLLTRISSDILLPASLESGAKCPFMSLPKSIDALTQRLSKNLRQNLRKYARKLSQDNYKIEIMKCEDFGSVESAMEVFFRLHQERWESKRMPGVFSTQEIRDFYIDIAKQFYDRGWLALYFMMANDEPIAAEYNYVYDQRMYFVLGGFDPDYSKYSVGHLLHQKALEDCIFNQIKEYDFLKGDEPYKLAWTKEYRRNLGIRFVNNRFSSSIYDWAIRSVKRTSIDKILGRFLDF